jgi:hypothetical protein
VEGTRWRIPLDVLALCLIALDEVVSRVHQAAQRRQPDEPGVGRTISSACGRG